MHFRHILSALGRHRIAVSLLVLEIAFSCAVVCNALFLIGTRLQRMHRPTGVDEAHLVEVAVRSATPGSPEALMAQTRTDLATLRALPGVTGAAIVNQPLFGDSISFSGVSLSDDAKAPSISVTQYMGGVPLADVLGLKMAAGRWFNPDEALGYEQLRNGATGVPVVITRDLAGHLFPGQSAVGKTIHAFGTNRVVGVVDRLVQPRDYGPAGYYGYAMLFPVDMPYPGGTYLLRVQDPAQRQAVIERALRALKAAGPLRLVRVSLTVPVSFDTLSWVRGSRALKAV